MFPKTVTCYKKTKENGEDSLIPWENIKIVFSKTVSSNSFRKIFRFTYVSNESYAFSCCSSALNDYLSAIKKMGCEILELMADGLSMKPRNVLSKLLMDEQSDSVFRLNNYPPCPNGKNMVGFGEHTDPQIISVLRSNSTSGLQISLRNGSWISVPPDANSFFINVGDSLQVHTYQRNKRMCLCLSLSLFFVSVSKNYFLKYSLAPLVFIILNIENT